MPRSLRAHGRDRERMVALSRMAMPSLFRFLIFVAVLCGLGWGTMYALANFVQPKPRDITVTIPPDRLAKPR